MAFMRCIQFASIFFTPSTESVLGMCSDAAWFVHVHCPTNDRLRVLLLFRLPLKRVFFFRLRSGVCLSYTSSSQSAEIMGILTKHPRQLSISGHMTDWFLSDEMTQPRENKSRSRALIRTKFKIHQNASHRLRASRQHLHSQIKMPRRIILIVGSSQQLSR
jgi:hypothetical protein